MVLGMLSLGTLPLGTLDVEYEYERVADEQVLATTSRAEAIAPSTWSLKTDVGKFHGPGKTKVWHIDKSYWLEIDDALTTSEWSHRMMINRRRPRLSALTTRISTMSMSDGASARTGAWFSFQFKTEGAGSDRRARNHDLIRRT